MTAERRQSGPFRAGDRVQLTGPKGRLNTITLEAGKIFHTHRGMCTIALACVWGRYSGET